MPIKDLTVEEWKEELASGLEYRRKYGLEDEWAELEALYSNVSPTQLNNGPNLIYSTGDTLMSTLTVPYPYIIPEPRRVNEVSAAPIVEQVFNGLVTDLKFQRHVENAGLSSYLHGRGFLKIGYDSEFGWSPQWDIQDKDNPIGISPTMMDIKGNFLETNPYTPGMPWVSSVLPHDIVVPWGIQHLDYSPWIIHRVVRHIDAVKGDIKYEKTRDLQPVLSMADFVKSYQSPIQPYRSGDEVVFRSSTSTTGKAEFVELWEIHDRRTGKVKVMATGHKSWLRNDDDVLAQRGLPFVSLSFVANARNFWVTPDAYYLKFAQAELTDISVQASKQRKIQILKFLYAKNALTKDSLQRLMSSEIGAAVEVEQGANLEQVIKTFQPSQNPQIYNEAEDTRRNARETVGFSRNQFGEFDDSSRRTATETNAVQQSSNQRMSRRQIQIRDMYIDAFDKIGAIIFKYWKAPRMANVLTAQGISQWVAFTGDQIKGNYRLNVTFSEDQGESRNSRRQMAMALYQQLIQDPAVDPIQARRYLANAMADPKFSAVYKPGILEGDPRAALQLQMQQSQMQSSPGGVPPDQGPAASAAVSRMQQGGVMSRSPGGGSTN